MFPVVGAMLSEFPAGFDQGLHATPRRQLVVILEGQVEVETGDGQKQVFRTGDMLLADDVGSLGHRTRTLGGSVRALYLQLPAEVEFAG